MKGQRGRPNQGKTQSVKERTVNVYLPTVELKQEWKDSAKETSLSLSQFVTEAVERYRALGSDSEISKPRGSEEDVESLKEELSKLKSNYAILEAINEKNESEKYRLNKLLEENKQGPCDIELARDMIFMFQKLAKFEISKEKMIYLLGIKKRDYERIQRASQTADFLIDLGVLDESGSNWVWLYGKKDTRKNRAVYGEKIQTTE